MNAIPENAARRAALAREIRERTGLDEAVIAAFLREFYDAARSDTLLAPAFAGLADWEAHLARSGRFWGSVALMACEYHGQPMQAHAHLGLTSAHFARWLALFEEVGRRTLPKAAVEHLLERARRIARSLEMGLVPVEFPPQRPAA